MTQKRKAARPKRITACEHAEAFAVAVFINYETDEAILIKECVDCGAALVKIGTAVTYDEKAMEKP